MKSHDFLLRREIRLFSMEKVGKQNKRAEVYARHHSESMAECTGT